MTMAGDGDTPPLAFLLAGRTLGLLSALNHEIRLE